MEDGPGWGKDGFAERQSEMCLSKDVGYWGGAGPQITSNVDNAVRQLPDLI